MPVSPPLKRLLGLLLVLCAVGLLSWTILRRVERVDQVTAMDAAAAQVDATSPTGYAGERRWLIVPEQHTPSYELVAETQQLFATGTWRVRHVDWENAPNGRPVYSASLYRWWLAGLAWINHIAFDHPFGVSVERAAVWSEPLLHWALLGVGAVFVARSFGPAAAVWFALATVFLFPLGGSFLPAVPDHRTLARLFALGSILPLLAALRPAPSIGAHHAARRMRRLFVAGGIAGGLGLWVDAPHQTWIIAGTALGAVVGVVALRRAAPTPAEPGPTLLPWRAWAWAGAATSTLGYLAEYAPTHLDLRLAVNHPLYGFAWIGVAELLLLLESWARQRTAFWRPQHVLILAAALIATAALPVALLLLRPQEWFTGDLFASRLTHLPNPVVAADFAAWLRRDGFSGAMAATVAPLLLLLPAVAVVATREAEAWRRRAIALALGTVLVTLPIALMQLEWWATVDILLLALLVTWVGRPAGAAQAFSAPSAVLRPVLAGLVILLSVLQLRPARASGPEFALTPFEVEALIERAAAHWMAERAGADGAVILVPPHRTVRWTFHGGSRVRGLGSAAAENRDGLAATIRIVTAQTGEEAQALLQERGVTHLVLPSWDEDLRQFARLALKDANDAFITAVHEWSLPSWLRPLPYPLPSVPGFEGHSIVVLQVSDETNRATALARMVEYFLETNRLELADAAGEALEQFPADANALVALGQLQKARGRASEHRATMDAVVAGLAAGFDRGMAWDRRVSLGIVLAQGERHDQAREQVQRCLERLDGDRMLTLTAGALYRLQVLARAYGLAIEDPALRERARQLLPEPLQERLQP